MAAKVIMVVVGGIVTKGRVFFICVEGRGRWRRIVVVGDNKQDGEVVDKSVCRGPHNVDVWKWYLSANILMC